MAQGMDWQDPLVMWTWIYAALRKHRYYMHQTQGGNIAETQNQLGNKAKAITKNGDYGEKKVMENADTILFEDEKNKDWYGPDIEGQNEWSACAWVA
jgi:hypothetical protein